MYQIKPIGPRDVDKSTVIPEFVIEAVNELINEKSNGSSFDIRKEEVKNRIMSKTSADFDWAWMDFEPIYRNVGWRVEYDRPGYNENYEAFYRFTPR